jgi:hypothetical protein
LHYPGIGKCLILTGGIEMFALASIHSGPSNFQEFVGVVLIVVVAAIAGLVSKSILIGMIAGCMTGALVEMGLFLFYGVIIGGELRVMTATVGGGVIGSAAGALGSWLNSRRERKIASSRRPTGDEH